MRVDDGEARGYINGAHAMHPPPLHVTAPGCLCACVLCVRMCVCTICRFVNACGCMCFHLCAFICKRTNMRVNGQGGMRTRGEKSERKHEPDSERELSGEKTEGARAKDIDKKLTQIHTHSARYHRTAAWCNNYRGGGASGVWKRGHSRGFAVR